MDNLYEFFRNHIKMALYGTRCSVYSELDLNVDVDYKNAESLDEEIKKLVPSILKIDEAVEASINEIDKIDAPAKFSLPAMDKFRIALTMATEACRTTIDGVMCGENARKRLFDVAVKRQEAQEKFNRIQKMKQAVNPTSLSGAPSDFNGAETVRVTKDANGDVSLAPVEQ